MSTAASAFESWFAARHPDIRFAGARAALELAGEGATVPFIARYRKERTGNLDEVAVRRALEAKELFETASSSRQSDHRGVDRAPRDALPGAARADPRHLRPRRRSRTSTTPTAAEEEPRARRAGGGARAARRLDLELRPRHGDAAGGPDARAVGLHLPQRGEGRARRRSPRSRARATSWSSGWRRRRSCGRSCARPTSSKGFLRATKAEKAKPHSKFETTSPSRRRSRPCASRRARTATSRCGAGSRRGRAPGRGRRAARGRGVRGAARRRVRGRGLHRARLAGGRGPAPRGPDRASRTTSAPRSRTRCTAC